MKNVIRFPKSLLLLTAITVFTALAMSGCKKDDTTKSTAKTYAISGSASGGQMVPSVSGNGTGTITGTYNPNTMQLTYTTNWTGLSGAPTSGGFYTGASGANGTAVGSSWAMGTGLTATGSTTGTMTLTQAQASQLTSGNWYYTLGTANNPNGEVRGQIIATQNP